MQAASSHVALAQVAVLSSALAQAIAEHGWQLAQLELQLEVHCTACAAPLLSSNPPDTSRESNPASAPPPDAITRRAQACSVLARLERASKRSRAGGAHEAKLPLLVLRVRGEAALLVMVEAPSGLLCLSAGASGVLGSSVATVRSSFVPCLFVLLAASCTQQQSRLKHVSSHEC
jgi:hypothetical protein